MDSLGERSAGIDVSLRRGARAAGAVLPRRTPPECVQTALDWGDSAPQRAGASAALVEAAREGIVLHDAQQRIVLLNPAAQRLFDSPPGCAAAGRAGQPFEVLLAPQADAVPLQGPGDAPDTTAYGCLLSVVEQAPIAIWIVDNERLSFANRAAARLAGAESAASLVGQSVFTLLRVEGHPELRRQVARTLAQNGEPNTLQARLVRINGDTREVEIALAALPQHGPHAVQMVVSDVSQRNREVRALERSRQALKRLSANAVEAREAERRRIARELHDELGQSLSALKMEIADCVDIDDLSPEHPRVSLILTRLDDIMNSVRRIAADLRPLMLDDLGLGDAIESLAHDFARRMGVQVHLHVEHIDPPAGERVSIALYRMVQEALTNVARHAHATEVHISLLRQDDELVLSVRDDGIGLPGLPPQRDSQYGLLGMQERADMLGGRLELDNLPDGGARVRVRVPMRRPAPSAMGTLAAMTAAAQAHGGLAAAGHELRDLSQGA